MGYIILSIDIEVLNLCNICNKICEFTRIYKQIRVSVIVSVEYNAANTYVQGKNDMLVLFPFARFSVVTV